MVLTHVPAGQAMHASTFELPVALRYRPVTQSMQSVASSLPWLPNHLPATHSMHVLAAVAPVSVEYVPVTQSMQSLAAVLPVTPVHVPAMQAMHSEAAVRPVWSWYFARSLQHHDLPWPSSLLRPAVP